MQLQKAALHKRPPSWVGVDLAKESQKNVAKYHPKMPNQIGGHVTAVGGTARSPLPAELVHCTSSQLVEI